MSLAAALYLIALMVGYSGDTTLGWELEHSLGRSSLQMDKGRSEFHFAFGCANAKKKTRRALDQNAKTCKQSGSVLATLAALSGHYHHWPLSALLFSAEMDACLPVEFVGQQQSKCISHCLLAEKQKQSDRGKRKGTSTFGMAQSCMCNRPPYKVATCPQSFMCTIPELPWSVTMDLNSFDLGLEAEEVVTILDQPEGKLVSIKFKGQSEPELIPINVANIKIPKMLIEFYEDHVRSEPSGREGKKKKDKVRTEAIKENY